MPLVWPGWGQARPRPFGAFTAPNWPSNSDLQRHSLGIVDRDPQLDVANVYAPVTIYFSLLLAFAASYSICNSGNEGMASRAMRWNSGSLSDS